MAAALAVAGVTLLLLFSGCSRSTDPWAGAHPNQTKVLACFPPLYCFAANVAGDHAKVMCLLTTKGPHDYEPTTRDALMVAGAKLFLINGLELDDDFAKKLKTSSHNNTLVVEEIGEAIPHKLLEHIDADHKHDEKEGAHHHHHGEHDPHIWLGLPQAQAMVKAIAEKLGEVDATHKDDFQKNAAAYIEELKKLEAEGKKAFADKKNRAFISTHDSLRYFAKSFGLEYVDSIQPQPGDEADANKMGRLVELCKEKNIGVLAVEPQYAHGQADALARAVRGKGLKIAIVEIDPMETAVAGRDGNPSKDFYVEQMRRNIDNLSKALP
jgi:ABC-type Zn uptake system ZnuABC Zn-binding protein ZnuA